MRDIIRDSALGQAARLVLGHELFPYPEEQEDFQLPASYGEGDHERKSFEATPTSPARPSNQEEADLEKADKDDTRRPPNREGADLENANKDAARLPPQEHYLHPTPSHEQHLSRHTTGATTNRTKSHDIEPVRTKDGIVLVDWYTDDDADNPQNWSNSKKIWISAQISIYTFAVYIGSSLYSPAEPSVVRIFGVSPESASLGLALYILGYGSGPMLWSPLSEIPVIGRSPVYISTLILFVLLCIPTSLISDYGGFLALRFFLGFFGSPCLGEFASNFYCTFTILV